MAAAHCGSSPRRSRLVKASGFLGVLYHAAGMQHLDPGLRARAAPRRRSELVASSQTAVRTSAVLLESVPDVRHLGAGLTAP